MEQMRKVCNPQQRIKHDRLRISCHIIAEAAEAAQHISIFHHPRWHQRTADASHAVCCLRQE